MSSAASSPRAETECPGMSLPHPYRLSPTPCPGRGRRKGGHGHGSLNSRKLIVMSFRWDLLIIYPTVCGKSGSQGGVSGSISPQNHPKREVWGEAGGHGVLPAALQDPGAGEPPPRSPKGRNQRARAGRQPAAFCPAAFSPQPLLTRLNSSQLEKKIVRKAQIHS